MGRVREIPRTAAFAWSPNVANISLVTGTRAGAVDADFSNDTKLEVWDLDVHDSHEDPELKPVGTVASDSRFYDIAWSHPDNSRKEGIIAGALESGSLDLWDAAKLRDSSADAHISRTTKHTGPIKTLQFNPHRTELLATSGSKGELYITDLNNTANPFRLGTGAARADDFDALDWNKQVPHIMATAGSGGFVTVWDVKSKKESLTLNNYGRKAVSSVAWNPDLPTKLATAVSSDQDPLILMWDLRNSSAPERILKGHEQGVLSLSWCYQDSRLLLSCGKDNRNICWNPHTGEAVGEFPIVTNWTFQTEWNPRQPNFLATASFDGKIAIHSIQNTNAHAEKSTVAAVQADDGADFFSKAHSVSTGTSFSLGLAPKWLQPLVGASFGFGGKLVSFGISGDGSSSKVKISTFASDPSVESSIVAFAEDPNEGDLTKLCEEKKTLADTDAQRTDWEIIATLLSDSPRKGLLTYLGFSTVSPNLSEPDDGNSTSGDSTLDPNPQTNGDAKSNRLSSFFDTGSDNQGFLAELAASKGARTNNPFHIYSGSESQAEKQITQYLMLGSFEQALDICLKENRMSDAFMIAICGGQKCIDKAQSAYFAQQSKGPNYIRLLASVAGKNLWDVVYNADLSNWSEVMATLCTFADETEFPDLCEALGDRLDESADLQSHASFCYLAGSKLEKVVPIWLVEMHEHERKEADKANDESAFSVHVKALQHFIQKVSAFRKATSYEDKEIQKQDSVWKLEQLYTIYAEYAELVAAYGHLDLADQFLQLLPSKYPAADLARDRVSKAIRRASRAPSTAPTARNGNLAAISLGLGATAQEGQTFTAPVAGLQAQTSRAYAPSTYQQQNYQSATSAYTPTRTFANTFQLNQSPVPMQSQNSAPPPSSSVYSAAASNGANWNDLPDSFASKPPTSRRGTPGLGGGPITSPFVSQGNTPLMAGNIPPPLQRVASPLAPPPRAGAPPRVASPIVDRSETSALTQRLGSSVATSYAPPPVAQGLVAPTAIPKRVGSPYNAPPATAPPPNKYAPSPSAQSSSAPGGISAQPMAARTIAPSPYAPQQASQSQLQYGEPQQKMQYNGTAPPRQVQSPPQAPPPQGPSPSSRPLQAPPPIGPNQSPRQGISQPQRNPTPAVSKYPPGDRSHIPSESMPIYDILNTEMQRIRGLAPANYKAQVDAADKRLNLLFDALNSDDINAEHLVSLKNFASAMKKRDFDQAQSIHVSLMKQMEFAGPWMIGVKNLIIMSKATPA